MQSFFHADNEHSDQTARMRRLIRVFVGAHVRRYVYSRYGSLDIVEYLNGKILMACAGNEGPDAQGDQSLHHLLTDLTGIALDDGGICLCWGFTAQSTQWDHVKRGQLPNHSFTGQA